jgi:hypothetical protein
LPWMVITTVRGSEDSGKTTNGRGLRGTRVPMTVEKADQGPAASNMAGEGQASHTIVSSSS